MRRLNGTEMKALFILSIVVPVGVLTTFKLTGMMGETRTINETTTLDTIKWEFQRPAHYAIIDDELNATYDSDILHANMSVVVADYINRTKSIDFDTVRLIFITGSTSTAPNSFVKNINIVIYKDQQSQFEWNEPDLYSGNLSLIERGEGYRWSTTAYVELTNTNRSASIYLQTEAHWELFTPSTQAHQLEVLFELIYYNGTSNKKIIQPFQLKILGSL